MIHRRGRSPTRSMRPDGLLSDGCPATIIAMDNRNSDKTPETSPVRGFDTFGDDARWFRQLLASKGVTRRGGSAMEKALEAMTRVSEYVLHPLSGPAVEASAARRLETNAGRNELKQLLLDAVAGANLVRMVRKAISASPTVFNGHWDLFRGPDVFVGKSGEQKLERDLMWELFIAAVCVHAADDVRIGKPDVRCRVREVSWGIECKVFNSSNPEKHIKRVKEAVRQLEGSDVHRGFVAVNVTNVVDHSHLDEAIRAFGEKLFIQDEILKNLVRQVAAVAASFREARFAGWLGSFPKTRALFFQANTTGLAGRSLPFLTSHLWVDLGQPSPADEAMANRFQTAAGNL